MNTKTLTKTLLNPLRMAITFQILKSGEITAQSIANNLGRKKNSIYYHLKWLKKAGVIVSRDEAIPGKNLTEKYYMISDDFLLLKKDPDKRNGKLPLRLVHLAELYEISALIMEIGQHLSQFSDKQYEKRIESSRINAKTFLLTSSQYKEIKERMKEIINDLEDYSHRNALNLLKKDLSEGAHFLSILEAPFLNFQEKNGNR